MIFNNISITQTQRRSELREHYMFIEKKNYEPWWLIYLRSEQQVSSKFHTVSIFYMPSSCHIIQANDLGSVDPQNNTRTVITHAQVNGNWHVVPDVLSNINCTGWHCSCQPCVLPYGRITYYVKIHYEGLDLDGAVTRWLLYTPAYHLLSYLLYIIPLTTFSI
jgi:hypothetical protein